MSPTVLRIYILLQIFREVDLLNSNSMFPRKGPIDPSQVCHLRQWLLVLNSSEQTYLFQLISCIWGNEGDIKLEIISLEKCKYRLYKNTIYKNQNAQTGTGVVEQQQHVKLLLGTPTFHIRASGSMLSYLVLLIFFQLILSWRQQIIAQVFGFLVRSCENHMELQALGFGLTNPDC